MTKYYILTLFIFYSVAESCCAVPPPLRDWPESNRLWLGIDRGSISPAKESIILSSGSGQVKFYKNDAQLLKEGDLYAILNEKNLNFEAQLLDIEERKYLTKVREIQIKEEEFIEKVETSIAQKSLTVYELENILRSPSSPQRLKDKTTEALSSLKIKIQKLKSKINPEQIQSDRAITLDELELHLTRKRDEFKELKRHLEFTAPFDGKLIVNNNFASKEENLIDKTFNINPGQIIASISDDQSFNFILSNKNRIFHSHQLNKLSVESELPFIQAIYSESRQIEKSGRFTRLHTFKISDSHKAIALKNKDLEINLYIYYNFSSPHRIIDKRKIAFLAPKTLEKSGWEGLIQDLYPNVSIVKIGPKSIAVKKK